MQLFLQLLNARTHVVSLEAGASVGDLKAAAHDLSAVPVAAMRLVCGRRDLGDHGDACPLGACDGVGDGSTVSLRLRLRGGIDFQHREGSKFGGGGVMSEQSVRRSEPVKAALSGTTLAPEHTALLSWRAVFRCTCCAWFVAYERTVCHLPPCPLTQAAQDRKERLRKLALETVDLDKDPYFMKNHLGSFECKLCLTLHTTEGNYLAHTQVRRCPPEAFCAPRFLAHNSGLPAPRLARASRL